MKRIFGTKKDKVPQKSLDDVSQGMESRISEYVDYGHACYHGILFYVSHVQIG